MQTTLVRPQFAVIQPKGHVNAGVAAEFQHKLATALSSQLHSGLLVDLSQVESLDSAGLMALVSALRLAQKTGKQFSLCSVSPAIRIIFELTQLDRVFEIFEDSAAFEAQIAKASIAYAAA